MKIVPQKTVLVVDDEDGVRESLERLLRGAGYTVLGAESGAEGLQILERERGVQLVLSDHNMPGMSGIEFLREVRARRPGVVRMMLTGDPDPETVVRAINESEVHRFVRKPWDNANLRATIAFAFETVLLEDEKKRLLDVVRRQRDELRARGAPADPEADLVLAEAELLRGTN